MIILKISLRFKLDSPDSFKKENYLNKNNYNENIL